MPRRAGIGGLGTGLGVQGLKSAEAARVEYSLNVSLSPQYSDVYNRQLHVMSAIKSFKSKGKRFELPHDRLAEFLCLGPISLVIYR
jgi:hypothetical protein